MKVLWSTAVGQWFLPPVAGHGEVRHAPGVVRGSVRSVAVAGVTGIGSVARAGTARAVVRLDAKRQTAGPRRDRKSVV